MYFWTENWHNSNKGQWKIYNGNVYKNKYNVCQLNNLYIIEDVLTLCFLFHVGKFGESFGGSEN